MKFLKVTALVGASMIAAPAAMAATILIDDFSDFQTAADLPTSSVGSSSSEVGGMLGGTRDFLVVNTTPVTPPPNPGAPGSGGAVLTSTGNGQPMQVQPINTLNFETGSGQTAIATVTYDGGGSGLGDLTGPGGKLDRFFFDILPNTQNFTGAVFTITVTDGSNNSDSVPENLDATFSPFTLFSSFNNVDFKDVASVSFEFNSSAVPGFDGSLASISVVPLPLSALLLLGGLGGLVGASVVSKRRRKA